MSPEDERLAGYIESLSSQGNVNLMMAIRTCLLFTGSSAITPLSPRLLAALKDIRQVFWSESGVSFEEYT